MDFTTLEQPGNYYDGRFQRHESADGELLITSPADAADVCARHPFARDAVHAALQSARTAWPAWRRLTTDARAEYLKRYQARLRAHHGELTQTIAREVGKPLWEAKTEVDAMIAKVDLSLGEARRYTDDVQLTDLPGEIRHRPLGVVAVIGPFNFPGHLPNGQIVPALLLGNCVVHKPSEKTPSVATWIARCYDEAGLPPGVFNLVQGPGEYGALLATHSAVDGLMFTGSSEVGRRILASQGDRIDRLVALELGGKNASIALDDCDLERTARAVAFSAYVTAGQRCTATSRLIATSRVFRPLVERIATIARQLRAGYPFESVVFMGPVVADVTRERLLLAQRKACAHGFEALVPGGSFEVAGRRGHYLRPALHVAPNPELSVPGYTDSELFAPDLAAYEVSDPDHAFALANRSTTGLTASVFTASRELLERA
ncbi:MAG: hypothetical protein RL701_4334, partial [Pseudomonadota bacterium]